ncbi:MAG: hypothetical protein NVS1B10_03320 [Candidatus Saccharimonadales bacterium]
MDDAKKQLADKLTAASNILVTVSRNPSVDQLTSCIGLTLLLNKQGKHAAAVFSGEVPSTIEFLQPEETLEKNTDSLRDFIIALDKNKADKLRYKVEDNVVRIFITPYKTSIDESDFDFSQGDFNVDVVVALGVAQQEDLDEAITSHGRIMHDATVTSINITDDGGLGTINWHDSQASSLSELVTELAQVIGKDLLDSQIANALLTGIVSETERFSNDKTSPQTMNMSSVLMLAGANQQLVASKLEEPEQAISVKQSEDQEPEPENDGTIEIDHSESEVGENQAEDLLEPVTTEQPELPSIDFTPPAEPEEVTEVPSGPSTLSPGSKLVTEPPTLGGTLTANSTQEALEPTTDPLSLPSSEQPRLLDRRQPPAETSQPESPISSSISNPEPRIPISPMTPPPTNWQPPSDSTQTSNPNPYPDGVNPSLTQLEETVKRAENESQSLDQARTDVNRALNNPEAIASEIPEPINALGAQPLGDNLHNADNAQPPQVDEPVQQTEPINLPPPVPPPIPFQFGNPPKPQ